MELENTNFQSHFHVREMTKKKSRVDCLWIWWVHDVSNLTKNEKHNINDNLRIERQLFIIMVIIIIIIIHFTMNPLFKMSSPLDISSRRPSRYISASCETMGPGQLVAVMSSYVCGPDCLGIEPRRLLRCRWEPLWMRCCVAERPEENSISPSGRLGLNAPQPQPGTRICKSKRCEIWRLTTSYSWWQFNEPLSCAGRKND